MDSIEGLENTFHIVGRDAAAGIREPDGDIAVKSVLNAISTCPPWSVNFTALDNTFTKTCLSIRLIGTN